MTEQQLYKCPECHWVGTVEEMHADAIGGGDGDEDEVWSNWICGHCHVWLNLTDYERVETRDGSPEPLPYGGI
jgi:hypothetical protein